MKCPNIPGRLRDYLLANNCMVHNGQPAEAYADLRAVEALKNAQSRPIGTGYTAMLTELTTDETARWELAAYIDSLAGLIEDKVLSATEVGLSSGRLRQIADRLDPHGSRRLLG
jgi:hypothetical protein